jgi:Xaa-Pro aminopeptidase
VELELRSFSDGEMARRLAAVRAGARERHLDAVVVTYVLHVEWLTGTWGSQFWVSPLVVPADGQPVYLVRLYDEDRVRVESRVPTIRSYFDRHDAVGAWAAVLRDLGVGDGRVGLELDNSDLTWQDVEELKRLLPGLQVHDASDLVPRLMAIKSDEELLAMRIAAGRTRAAVEAFRAGIAPGVSELELHAEMRRAALAAGSDDLRGGVSFGSHTTIPHGDDGDTRLMDGDPAYTECSGYHLGYCATLCRSAVVGTSPGAERLYDAARRAVDAVEAALRPGATTGEVDAAARDAVERAGYGAAFRHRTGYAVGLRANGRLNLSLRPGGTERIETGMTFHTPIILIEPGVAGMACSETFLVSPAGGVPLAGLDRELTRA